MKAFSESNWMKEISASPTAHWLTAWLATKPLEVWAWPFTESSMSRYVHQFILKWNGNAFSEKNFVNYFSSRLSHGFIMVQIMLYNRHGQSAARGPHAALQTFFAALDFKYTITIIHNYLRKFDFLSLNMTFLKDITEEHFRNLLRFSQICREIFKITLYPSTNLDVCLMFGMNLQPQEHSNYWKWPLTKKVWPPLLYNLF